MSYVQAVQDGAVSLPVGKFSPTEEDDGSGKAPGFPLSPLDVPRYAGIGFEEHHRYEEHHRPNNRLRHKAKYDVDGHVLNSHGDGEEAVGVYSSSVPTDHFFQNDTRPKVGESPMQSADEMGYMATDL